MANEHWLATPLERHGLALWNGPDFDFNAGKGKHASRRRQGVEELEHEQTGGRGDQEAGVAHQKVVEGAVVGALLAIAVHFVLIRIRHLLWMRCGHCGGRIKAKS